MERGRWRKRERDRRTDGRMRRGEGSRCCWVRKRTSTVDYPACAFLSCVVNFAFRFFFLSFLFFLEEEKKR